MATLDAFGTDPCSLLNSSQFSSLWISGSVSISGSSDSTVLPFISASGVPVTFSAVLTSLGNNINKTILATPQANSKSAFMQFLSGSGVTSSKNSSVDYSLLQNVLLSKPGTSTYESIVDTFIVKNILSSSTPYTYSTNASPLLQDNNFWSTSDSTTGGGIVASPKSLLGMLLGSGYLLQQGELFKPSEFDPSIPPPAPGTESLVYLYQLNLKKDVILTTAQNKRVIVLEAKNLRFFGAFLAEYCYYRTRYEYLLQKYFSIYKLQGGQYSSPALGSPIFGLFNGTGTQDNQYTGSSLTQQDYLKGIMYHMACLNTRMTDLRKLLSMISNYYSEVFNQIQNTINAKGLPGSNSDLDSKIVALRDSSKYVQKYMSELDFHKGVMEYNSEKNRYSNILLGLYAFLNIAAVAMIVKLSRS